MVVGEKRTANIMDGIENTGDVRLHDHRLRLKQRFDIVRKLGQGTYGKVQLGINKKTGQEVAIKTIKKCKIESEADLVRIRREVQIMSSVRHPNIVHIYEVFENSEKMILVMEYCSGGELYDYLSQKKVLEEEEARRIFRQIATAVYYCHIHKICHRDLKLENVLLDDTGSAKIADFGLSNVFKETSLLSTFCGSPLYASPEIVKGTPYIGPEVDCWSLGVLLYTLVYGAMPFDGSNFKRLVRQISNGDYYEPKNPSSASPLIRDMLTVDPLKRADITYICDHSWVNMGCETSCLEMAEALAAETPVRLDLLLSLAPVAPSNSNSVVVPSQTELGPEESCTDLTSSTSMAVEPSNSAEKRILELVAEGGEDAIKPSPTRIIVAAGDGKRKLEASTSNSNWQRKKERVASAVRVPEADTEAPTLPEETTAEEPVPQESLPTPPSDSNMQPTLKSSATMTISPSPKELPKEPLKDMPELTKEDAKDRAGTTRPRVTAKKKISPPKTPEEKIPTDNQEKSEKPVEAKEGMKPSSVATAADKLTSLSLAQQPSANQTPTKPKKLSIPGGNVGSFKEQFERRASLTTTPEIKRNLTKTVVSKIAKPKAQSEEREMPAKIPDNGTVRLQQIGIEPSVSPEEISNVGVKKTESEPSHSTTTVDPTVLLQDARRSLQSSMAKLVEEKAGEESRRRAARDIISSAIRTGKPPMPYGRSSSAGVTALGTPPGTPPAVAHTAPIGPQTPRIYRTEAHHRVEDHRNRGVSVERIIPIHVAGDESPTSPVSAATAPPPASVPVKPQSPAVSNKVNQVPLRRLVSSESSGGETCVSPGEPIKKSAREFIIPIAVEGKGYVTPRQGSMEPSEGIRHSRPALSKPRRISLVSGGESEEEDDTHMHRLRSTRAARAESVSSGEEEEDDEGFHLLTAENLFSTLLHRVRALTQRLNGEEGPGFPQHPHSLFNNLQSPFFNSAHLQRRHNALREGWGTRDLHADFDSMFKNRQPFPRGNNKKSSKHQTKASINPEQTVESGLDLSDLDLSSIQISDKEMEALSGLTPALSRRLQRQLLAQLPPAAARTLRRTLSLQGARPNTRADSRTYARSQSDTKPVHVNDDPAPHSDVTDHLDAERTKNDDFATVADSVSTMTNSINNNKELELPSSQFSTLPRSKRQSTTSRESTPPISPATDTGYDYAAKSGPPVYKELSLSRGSSVRSTPDRPLLSKYLTPERTASLDESYSSDSGSILSEPSYIAAYGSSAVPSLSGLGFRRHSMRLSGEQPKKRVSRFLRPDFFDSQVDENAYLKHKKEKELETQKILREIREKKNKPLDSVANVRSPTDSKELLQMFKDEPSYSRKCLSPIAVISGKERSRSNTPFFPILDNIKETVLDVPQKNAFSKPYDTKLKSCLEDIISTKESRLLRPKSYPVKNDDTAVQSQTQIVAESKTDDQEDCIQKSIQKESKLIRPKSYPTSSPSPEKIYINRNNKKDELKNTTVRGDTDGTENNADVEVSFNINLPKKSKTTNDKTEIVHNCIDKGDDKNEGIHASKDEIGTSNDGTLTLRKYEIVDKKSLEKKTNDINVLKTKSENSVSSNVSMNPIIKEKSDESKPKDQSFKSNPEVTAENIVKNDDDKNNKTDKKIVKKKVIKKVSSKSKTDLPNNQEDVKTSTEKKKVIKKIKEKCTDEKDTKTATVTKKKSVLQSIGQKLEKLANKSNSPEKDRDNQSSSLPKDSQSNSLPKDIQSNFLSTNIPQSDNLIRKIDRQQREQSVPAHTDSTTESNLIKRAATLTNVTSLENQNTTSKTTVSKVLGLFKKFDVKEKNSKNTQAIVTSGSVDSNVGKSEAVVKSESVNNTENEKPKRPTSLLLNGIGRRHKYVKNASDSVSVSCVSNECAPEQTASKKDSDIKNLKNSLKLDFSRLPRVKKIAPTNSAMEPQMMDVSLTEKDDKKTDKIEKSNQVLDSFEKKENMQPLDRSRSTSKSEHSNPDNIKDNPVSPGESCALHPLRSHENTNPDKEDVVERIRRKSFYSRFNEKRQKRRSTLVGPGATEYDPVARIHGPPSENKYDLSPTSPIYDLSPGLSVASDLSPVAERYRSLGTDYAGGVKTGYSLGDKLDSYRSLDRKDFRKAPVLKSYLDYDSIPTYGSHRYSRTLSLVDGPESAEDQTSGSVRDSLRYNRTLSMYSPGNYATYRPMRVHNSAILLKDGEKEPSPENVLDKIRQRKKASLTATKKPELEKETPCRSNVSSKGESDGAECSEKVD